MSFLKHPEIAPFFENPQRINLRKNHRRLATPVAVISSRAKKCCANVAPNLFELSAPVRGDPDTIVAAMHPAATNPYCARMRTGRPAATRPDPAPAPFPTAANPNESRIRSRSDDFDLRRRRRGVFYGYFSLRRRARRGLLDINRTVAINDLSFHAAGKERQRGCDYYSFN
jgi:hypothetical protein